MDTIKIKHRRTLMVAHRGLSGIERENTAAAFIAAGNRSYFGCECDVRLTSDHKYVISHDADLKRNAGVDLAVKDATYSELDRIRMFDVVKKEETDYYSVLLFEDYIKICKRYEKKCIIEFKCDYTKEELLEILEIIDNNEYLENCIFISFYKNPLVLLRGILKDTEIQFLNDKCDDETFEFCKKYNFGLDVQHKALTKQELKKYHSAGLKVNVWTVDDVNKAKEFVRMGVDYITTNIIE